MTNDIKFCIKTLVLKFLPLQIFWMLQCFKLRSSPVKFHPPNSTSPSFHAIALSVLPTLPPSTSLNSHQLPPQLPRGPSMVVSLQLPHSCSSPSPFIEAATSPVPSPVPPDPDPPPLRLSSIRCRSNGNPATAATMTGNNVSFTLKPLVVNTV